MWNLTHLGGICVPEIRNSCGGLCTFDGDRAQNFLKILKGVYDLQKLVRL